MKAKPLKLVHGQGYLDCSVEDATHVRIHIPSRTYPIELPIILKGSRDGTGCWTWNGNTVKPTLRPSVLTQGGNNFRCHSWINDGSAQFLGDCSHDSKNQTIELLEVI
ncbi:MAG: DUF6527 family protein [Candidatus Reddybacter sp.]